MKTMKILMTKPNRRAASALLAALTLSFGIGVATPREMVSLLERLYRGEIVSKDASSEAPKPRTTVRAIRAGSSNAPESAEPSQSRIATCVSAITCGGRSS